MSHWEEAGRAVLIAATCGLAMLTSACEMSPELDPPVEETAPPAPEAKEASN